MPPVAAASFGPGTHVDHFRVDQEVGRGGNGVVLKAYDEQLSREVALKLMLGTNPDASARARFNREATAVSRLKHPHLASVYSMGEAQGQPYLVMEWIPGETLQALIQREGALPLSRALKILRQVGDGLDFAHSHGILHRDIKTANIMIGQNDHAVLVDFGLAFTLGTPSLTETGTVFGTPRYMAPEQIKGDTLDAKADLYSLAMVAYEVLTGAPAFNDPQVGTVLYKQVNEKPPALSEANPALSTALDAAMAKALAKKPQDRFPSAKAFLDGLDATVTAAPALPSQSLSTAPLGASSGGARSLALGVGLGALLLAAVLAPRALPSRSPNSPSPTASASASAPAPATPEEQGWKVDCDRLAGLAVSPAGLLVAETKGVVRMLSPLTGKKLWQQTAKSELGGPPLVSQGMVLVFTGSKVLALEAATGHPAWSKRVDSEIEGMALEPDGNLCVAQSEQLTNLDPATGDEAGPKDLSGTGEMLLPPCPCSKATFVATSVGGLMALSPEDQHVLWKVKVRDPDALAVSPEDDLALVALDEGTLKAYSISQGKEAWSADLPGTPRAMTCAKGVAVLTCQEGQVLVIDPKGNVRWQVRLGDKLKSDPVIDGDAVLVAGPDSQLHRLDLAKGLELAALPLPGVGYFAPLVDGDRLYVGSVGWLSALPRPHSW